MLVFFDTEFNGLTSDPRLLSIGLVSDSGKELYIEFRSGWAEPGCSAWVREHVLPLLGDGEQLTRSDAGRRIAFWLSSFETAPTLLGDSDWDTILLAELMDECEVARDTYRIETLRFLDKAQFKAFEDARQRYFESQKAVPHHALVDARALRAAWNGVFIKPIQ